MPPLTGLAANPAFIAGVGGRLSMHPSIAALWGRGEFEMDMYSLLFQRVSR
ncbi:hypothetical protein GIY23_10445 [Allosaccharopolyspora coralli]|uniref:Uncharacterized protein n=1 Tax=Allosaccharopolyspora coralli TaxID=2665642 RepID=A0A5Q3Q5Y6_9PSEU|nr:hypothetical protein [Allosaccharopolyspora coralli]QGK69882.1 hypothetical protein GIY23_10445 [Allosaccharopolyspora coralli]